MGITNSQTNPNSRKYLLALGEPDCTIEIAFLDMGNDRGICASAQAGCAFQCRHCATTYAPKPFIRNITDEEIVDAIECVRADVAPGETLDYLDFSGIGDCSANWDAVRNACLTLAQRNVIKRYSMTSIAPRQWTERVIEEQRSGKTSIEKVMISLHGPDLITRRLLIPQAEDPWKAVQWWRPLKQTGCRVILNYVAHKENSTYNHSLKLSDYLQANMDWFNIIRISPLNPVTGMQLIPASDETFELFINTLKKNIGAEFVTIFNPFGRDIGMGCGQMRALDQSKKNFSQDLAM